MVSGNDCLLWQKGLDSRLIGILMGKYTFVILIWEWRVVCVCVWGGGVCALIYLWTDKRMYPCSSNGIMHEALWRQKGLDSAWISDLTDKFRSSNYAVCQPNPAQPQKCHMILYIQSEDVNKKKGWMRRGDVTFHFCNGITSQKLWRIYSGRVEVHFTQYSSK